MCQPLPRDFSLIISCALHTRCTCLSVDVSFDDGANFDWHWIAPLLGKSRRFGTNMKVKWHVLGHKSECKYFQRESANFKWISDSGSQTKSARWSDHTVSSSYTDDVGGTFVWPGDRGNWTTRIFKAPSITLECQSSDGTKISVPVTVPSPPDPGKFPQQ